MTDLDQTTSQPGMADPAAIVEAARSRGVFLVPRCEDCGRTFWHPRRHCPHCLSTRVRCVEPSGPARVVTWTRNHRPQRDAGGPATLGYVQLDDGLRVLVRLEIPDDRDPVGLDVVPEPRETPDGGRTVVFVAARATNAGGR